VAEAELRTGAVQPEKTMDAGVRAKRKLLMIKTYLLETMRFMKNHLAEAGHLNSDCFDFVQKTRSQKNVFHSNLTERLFKNDPELVYDAFTTSTTGKVVVRLTSKIDVYDIESPNHNFALASCVFPQQRQANGRSARTRRFLPFAR